MKNLFNFLVLFLLVACSLFAQSWSDLPKVLNGPTLTGINLSYPSIGDEGLFAGNFSGTEDGTVVSQRVIKYNSTTETFHTVGGLTSGDEVKGFYVGNGGRMQAYGKFGSAGIIRFNAGYTAVETMQAPFTGPGNQSIDAAWSFGGVTLVYGATLIQINGTPLSAAHSVALIDNTTGTVTNLPNLVPSISGETPSIQNIRHDGSNWIIMGNFSALGSTSTIDVGVWDETNVIATTGIPSASYARDLEGSILGHSTGPMGFSGTSGYPLGNYPIKVQDIEVHSNGTTWACGSKLPGGNTRIASFNGSWNNEEDGLINAPYINNTNVVIYGMVAFPDCMVAYGNFSPPVSHCRYMATTCSSPLPIKLVSFEGKKTNEGNKLDWETKSEINNDYFEIESSEDGETFKKIGLVEGKNSPSDYSFLDENPKKENYYRLKQIDFDGKFEFSKIIFLENKNNIETKIYPNPFVDYLKIETNEIDIAVYDSNGNIVSGLTNLNENSILNLNLSHLKKGTYNLKIGKNTKRIIKVE